MKRIGVSRDSEASTTSGPLRSEQGGMGRRGFVGGTLAVGSFAAVGGLLSACSSSDGDGDGGGSGGKGPERTIIWAAPNIGDWNTPIDVGFKEFCDQVGWKYQKIGQADQDPPRTVQAIMTSINSKPAAIIMTVDTPNVYDKAIDAAVAAGIHVGVMTAFGNEDYVKEKYPQIGYVGASDYLLGVQMGSNIVRGLEAAGVTSGIVLSGNPQAGSATSEARIKGIQDAFDEAGASGLQHEVFVSDSKNPTQSASDWTVRLKQGGSDVVAFAPLQVVDATIAQSVLESTGKAPGEIPMWSIDIDSGMIQMIKDGWVTASVDQQFWAQGYYTAASAWASIERFVTHPPRIDTGTASITKDNVANVEEGISIVEKQAKALA